MGKNYVICTLGYSWDRITWFHCTQNAQKYVHVILYRERITSFASKGYSCKLSNNMAMNLIDIPSGVTRGVPCYYFTSNVKVPHLEARYPYIGKELHPLPQM